MKRMLPEYYDRDLEIKANCKHCKEDLHKGERVYSFDQDIVCDDCIVKYLEKEEWIEVVEL